MKTTHLKHTILRYAAGTAAALLSMAAITACDNDGVTVAGMRCEYAAEPQAVDTETVRFTWHYEAETGSSAFRQRAAEIRIAETEEALADAGRCTAVSGRVKSGRPFVEMSTAALAPDTRYCWQVRVYDRMGRETACSPAAWFSTGKLHGQKWQAEWITDSFDKDYEPAPMLRKRFGVKGEVSRARLYISAAGYYDAALNGRPVTDGWLNPGLTHYDKRNLYLVHDVTPLVRKGDNVITATLGNGFYNEYSGMAVWQYESARWRNRPRMICELHIDYTDGRHETVVSDASWRTATGPVRGNVIYAGDIIDARCAVEGWDDPSTDDSAYPAAVVCSAPSPLLTAQNMPAIRESDTYRPVSVSRMSDREYVFSFAKNMTGVCTLRVKGEAGTRITMEHGELLREDGTVEMHNIDFHSHPVREYSLQRDIFTLAGGGEEEVFTPKFHYNGFQYVTVKADRPVELDRSSLTAHFLHSDVEPTGEFRSSNELLNRLWRAVRRSYLCNLQGIPTDCPHREKNGWTADAFISMDIALTNFDAIGVYEKWMDDFVDNQREDGTISGIIPSAGWGYGDWPGPVWDAAMFIVPDALYDYYGDERAIRKIWPVAERYLDYISTRENADGTVDYGLGDWCFYKTQTPSDFTAACFYYHDNVLMARFAQILGRDGSRYAAKAAALREMINGKYLDRASGAYSIGRVTAQAVPLALGIVPEEMEEKVAARLNDAVIEDGYTCDFGLLGSKYALRMLVKYGYVETAYRLATQTRVPSWGNWIKSGFTTPLETWALRENFSDSSANHVFFGDIAAWMQSDLAGINYDRSRPGFDNVIIHPHYPGDMQWAEASLRTVRGTVRSAWRRDGDRITLEVTLPVNTTATVYADGKRKIKGDGSTHRFTVKNAVAK